MSDNSAINTSGLINQTCNSDQDESFASKDANNSSIVSEQSDCSKMDIDSSSSSIVQDAKTPSKDHAPSAKKIKLSVTEQKLLKAEREQLKKERDILRAEREKVRLEKEKERIAKEKERIERDKLKLKQKEEREAEKEKKNQELQLKKIQLEKEKNEKLRLKEEERERKEREKKEKDDEKNRIRDEKEKEKQRRQDEKSAFEEKKKQKDQLQEKKLQQQRDVLFNFLKKSKSQSDNSPNKLSSIKNSDLSQITPKSLLESFDSAKFELEFNNNNAPDESNYLNQLLSGKITGYVVSQKAKNVECEIVEDLPNNSKYIFLQFHENIRPAYFGKRSNIPVKLNGRSPFTKEEFLDYEVDSDEEWDEGGPGESLSESDSDHEEKDDYEIDDKFFVPHGYLSDDENNKNSETADVESDSMNSGPLLKEQTLMAERNRKFANHLTPQIIGCVWYEDKDATKEKFEFLQQFKAALLSN